MIRRMSGKNTIVTTATPASSAAMVGAGFVADEKTIAAAGATKRMGSNNDKPVKSLSK